MRAAGSSTRLIHFFGPDGAGKSTQVDLLIEALHKNGLEAQKCWVRAHHTLAFLLWKFFIRIGFSRVVINPFGPPGRLPAVDRNRLLQISWSLIEFIGVLPIILRIHYWLWRGRILVAERYVLDTVTTIAYFINDMRFVGGSVSRLLLRFIPDNTVFIFLDADYETIYKRRAPLFAQANQKRTQRDYGAIPRCPVEPQVFIEFQRKAYKMLAKSFDPLIIDTSKSSVEETSKRIRCYLELC